jgi:hypothetical protein
VLLGAKAFIQWGGLGFGVAHPRKIVLGGDPSLMITEIRWHGWGRTTAWGVGRNPAYHYGHGGNYYSRQGRAEVRVYGIGHCRRNGPRVYMGMTIRVPLKPGAAPTRYVVGGSHGLCSFP